MFEERAASPTTGSPLAAFWLPALILRSHLFPQRHTCSKIFQISSGLASPARTSLNVARSQEERGEGVRESFLLLLPENIKGHQGRSGKRKRLADPAIHVALREHPGG